MSTRPLDYTQINRCLRLIIRAFSAQARAPKQLTDQEQIDNLIKKVFQDNIDKGDLDFRDLVPVRMARPGDKWWPWRMLLPLRDRWRYGLIDPDEPWPHEENEKLAEIEAMQKFIAEAYNNPDFFNDLEDDDDAPDDDEDYLSEDDDSDDEDDDDAPDDDEHPPNLTVIPDTEDEYRPNLTVIPAEAGIHPSETTTHNLATHPAPGPSPIGPTPTPHPASPAAAPLPNLSVIPVPRHGLKVRRAGSPPLAERESRVSPPTPSPVGPIGPSPADGPGLVIQPPNGVP